jgi:DNA-binding PadR family transcriptional regulator
VDAAPDGPRRKRELSTTSYAILGLLALRAWTPYELAKQMERSLHFYWPRAESKLYEEPKKLVAYGLASVERQVVGRRPRSVYTITPAGRRALATWVRETGDLEPAFEFEPMVRVTFSEHGTPADLLQLLRAIQAHLETWETYGDQRAREYLETGGPFPHRLALVALVSQFVYESRRMVREWAAWAERHVMTWESFSQVDATALVDEVFRARLEAPASEAQTAADQR